MIINERKKPMKYFAIHLRDKRLTRGWDQETIAHMSGLSVRTIQRIEAGNSCSLESMKSLSAAMDLKHFSELMPQPSEDKYNPTAIDLVRISARELIFAQGVRVVTITLLLIGLISSFYIIDMVDHTSRNLSIEERVETKIKFNKSLGTESPLFISKTEEQFRADVIKRMESESRPLNNAEWKELKQLMISLFYFCFVLTTIYSLFRVFSTYEFSEVVIKPLERKMTSLIKSTRLNY